MLEPPVVSRMKIFWRGGIMSRWQIACWLGLLWYFTVPVFPAGEVTESSTGQRFPGTVTLSADGRSFTLDCTGAGVRKKLVVKVYALGFYLDAGCRQELQRQWQPKAPSSEELEDQPAFFQALVDSTCARRFELKFVRDVEAEKIRESFHEGIAAHLTDLPRDQELAAAERQFIAWFQSGVRTGGRLTVHLLPDGIVEAYHNDSKLGRLRNSRLASGIAAIWLGRQCISESLRNELIRQFYR